MKGHVERIEQAGDRVAITAGQVIHDMRTTGKTKDGVNEVAGYGGSPISVAAQWENGSLNLRPGGGRVVAVTRRWTTKERCVGATGLTSTGSAESRHQGKSN